MEHPVRKMKTSFKVGDLWGLSGEKRVGNTFIQATQAAAAYNIQLPNLYFLSVLKMTDFYLIKLGYLKEILVHFPPEV